ncbi:MAG: NADH-quinone oxidoreductase subunit NuoN [Alphaproteobacteria bacterium]
MKSEMASVLYALPEIYMVCAAMALLMVGVFKGEGSTRLVSWLSVAALIGGMALVVLYSPGDKRVLLFADMFITDRFAVFVKVAILAASAVCIIMSMGDNEREKIGRFEFPVLILLATVGMMMMVSANDLISLYIGLELQSLALYVVAAFKRDSIRSTEAGLKYFVLGALSSGMLLYGASLVYGFAGTTSFGDLAAHFAKSGTPSVGVVVGMVFVIVGLAFKVSAVPFHMWTPDVYEGAPTPVTAFFAAVPKLAATALFVRVMIGPFGPLVGQWKQVLMLIAIGSMLWGSFAAISQNNIKRLMAYSSIGNIGYALIGLVAANEEGVRSVLVYMAIYVVTVIGTFGCILFMRRSGQAVEQISDLSGLSKTQPAMAALLAIFMFSLAGIPPLAGFFGKLYIFLGAIHAGLITLAIIGVLTSVIGAYYYLRVVKVMYFDEPGEALDRPDNREVSVIRQAAAALTVLFILLPDPLLRAAERAAKSLLAG